MNLKQRDPFKSYSYFKELVDREVKDLEKIERRFEKDKNSLDVKILQRQEKLYFDFFRNLLIAKYSKGDDFSKDEVKKILKKSAMYFLSHRKHGGLSLAYVLKDRKPLYYGQYVYNVYVALIQLLSIARLILPPNDEYFILFHEQFERDNVKDLLLEYLVYPNVNLNFEESEKAYVDIDKNFGHLKKVIQEGDKINLLSELKFFLENKWYQCLKGSGYYGTHKSNEIHRGYWCFLAAAIVKIENLNDETLRGNIYYPDDLN
ncbi:PoNi-like cognate immunity protein [Mangrovimonas sp. AS39]|uniref:PoNe immunity protein domain-containing protein n=1 Tax=Mangrovimonas TaxID=1211036 RepID=UPI0006B631B9|nr:MULTISPECIES: PoNe immunity protein domain-containing protein [Mangrovimonas]MCF1192962.1 PoNi-like cognate immunity protein [Mangrovimonas futianensis]MCF1196653.1 PoNi-like cognate immunity protein [Mangrovimonas futianensis]MCF1421572.1 PoNi-like cognate immunity protein [Mangrovimonas futianensis]